ncbi:MAG: alpha-L-fucosidase [Provencibacterium sp.]|jgi:alpha-L-fucosidase|nr:alpha-L-fucosidase [Provencibacterium sp.]
MDEQVKRLIAVTPQPRQIAWQELEFTAFIHFGMNAFTNREWGDGSEDPAIFHPSRLDTDQWCAALCAAGIKAVLLTAKHHDGFCLWDTKQTDHSVMRSPYGKDIFRQLSISCKKFGLKLGVYLSPWDRHDPRYGQGKPYDDFFCAQLTELLTGYGELYCVWFDGACGEGPNGKRQRYDWARYYQVIRSLQPGAVISVCGPDVRWCGNEAGHCRPSEWSVVAAGMRDNEKIHEKSQQADDDAFRERTIPSGEEDLGSRQALAGIEELIWYPAEVNTSIRPGWFYHPEEDEKVKPLEELKKVYLQAVGGNAVMLLNIPPNREGLFAVPDVRRLCELGDFIRGSLSRNLLEGARFSASAAEADHPASLLEEGKGYWKAPDSQESAVLEITAAVPVCARYLRLKEEITRSQRIEGFILEALENGEWRTVCEGTTAGYQRIVPFSEPATAQRWRLTITASRAGATLKALMLH